MRPVAYVITCEHAGNRIPSWCLPLFEKHQRLLATHRAFDAGAYETARQMARFFAVPLFATKISRLVIDCNRSLGSTHLFSPITRPLPFHKKNMLRKHYYEPYRTAVEAHLFRLVQRYRVYHFSIHSFTPVKNGVRRTNDIGLLYDPKRVYEKHLCMMMQQEMHRHDPALRIRYNYPYRGIADGFTRYLRTVFLPEEYCGIEIEINQKGMKKRAWNRRLAAMLGRAIRTVR